MSAACSVFSALTTHPASVDCSERTPKCECNAEVAFFERLRRIAVVAFEDVQAQVVVVADVVAQGGLQIDSKARLVGREVRDRIQRDRGVGGELEPFPVDTGVRLEQRVGAVAAKSL